MPKYSSRISTTNISNKPKKAKMSVVPQATVKPLVIPKETVSNIQTGGSIKTAGILPTPKRTGTTRPAGLVESPPFNPNEAGAISTAGAITTAGSISTGGALKQEPFGIQVTPESAMRLGYPAYIHALGSMSPQDFHLLQGLASAYMPTIAHPMKDLVKSQFGGSLPFKLPRNISRVAHKDILKAITPQQLSNALHMEMLDMGKSKKGGALLDSIRNLYSKGVSGLKRGATALVKGAKAGVGALKTGLQIGSAVGGIGLNVAERLSNNLNTGIQIANTLSPLAQLVLGEEVKGPIRAGIDFATQQQQLLQAGIDTGRTVQSVVDPLIQQFASQPAVNDPSLSAEPEFA